MFQSILLRHNRYCESGRFRFHCRRWGEFQSLVLARILHRLSNIFCLDAPTGPAQQVFTMIKSLAEMGLFLSGLQTSRTGLEDARHAYSKNSRKDENTG